MRIILTFLIVSILILPSIASAQDEGTCDIPAIQSEFATRISQANTLDELHALNLDFANALRLCGFVDLADEAESIIKNTDGTGLRDDDVERVVANHLVVTLRYGLHEQNRAGQANRDFALIACNLWDHGFLAQDFQFTATMNGGKQEAVEMILPASAREFIDCNNPENVSMALYAERYDIHKDLNPTPASSAVLFPTNTPADNDQPFGIATPASTPIPTVEATSTPQEIGESGVFFIVEGAMIINEIPLDEITRSGNILYITMPATHSQYSGIEYYAAAIGGLSGALSVGYNDPSLGVITKPETVVVEFKSGTVVIVRIAVNYQSMEDFIAGTITADQFLNSWVIE